MENIIVYRRDDGTVETNLPPPLLIHHSPEGLDFGSNNPGTDDLALNMLHYALSTRETETTIDLGNGQFTYWQAYQLHEWFAQQTLVHINPDLRQWQWAVSVLLKWIDASLTD